MTREEVSVDDSDDLRSLLTAGEVVSAGIMETEPDWQLSLMLVEETDEPRVAVALLTNGPPWLLPAPPRKNRRAHLTSVPP